MYRKTSLSDSDTHEFDGGPTLNAVGYELRPDEMRPSVWQYDEGESNKRHKQGEQEELYVPLSGRFEMTIGDETIDLAPEEYVVVSPDEWRQVTAVEAGTLLVVGAPNVKDDGILPDE
ncbi:cupin domain-containing protein [Haloferacaceae archaeon DSL9]